MGRHAHLRPRRHGKWGVGLIALLLSACSLSPEQLSLPASITGATGDSQQASSNGRPGVPLADAGDEATRGPRVYPGTGQFAQNPAGGDGGSERARSKVDGNGVTLNLVGASVPEVAKTVLGDILKLNYTVSDKAKASITLSTAQPVPKEDLLKIFESILRSEGLALSVENGVYRVLPGDAVARGTPRWAPRGRQEAGDGTTIVPLRYVSATEMERVLKSVAPQTSILRVDNARNLLIVSGSATELASVNDTVEAFDLDWMRGMSFALLPVESADPEAIAKELDTIFANDSDSPTKGIVRFVPNTRLKSVLVISSRPEYLRKAEGWLRRIDLAGQATEKQVHVYHVQNRPAGELAVLLRKVYNSQSNNNDRNEPSTQPGQDVSVLSSGDDNAGGGGLGTQGLSSGFGQAGTQQQRRSAQQQQGGGIGDVAQPATGDQPQGRGGDQTGDRNGGIGIVADDPNNSVIITATVSEYKRIRQILSRIDIAGKQVLLEATIAEVTLSDQLKFGLKWFFQKGNNEATFTTPTTAGTPADVLSGFGGFSYFLNTPNVQVALNALNQVTTVNLVSSPSLMVLDNKKAVLQIGDEVPFATQQAQGTQVPGAPVINSISFRSTGVILSITPRVGENGRIQLDIEQEVSDAKRTETSDLDSPTISQRRVKTSVAVGDGECIVLAGLMRDNTSVSHDKVPLMGDIPVVGNLFKNKTDEITRTELLIAITPHVVKDARQVRGIAQEFRDRMNFSTRPQRGGPPDRRENVDRVIVR
ncbi:MULTISPECIES: type II secretion system secretin GspD [Rhodomicrobium]|uniref:type II secretion system secretin GspD n=1 Tax=Rhodomicrobium TaxID=1068 RepID=UPI0014825105|nr:MULTISPECIES: type II secretion system secretin GspD [Rhodomicrobium]